MKELITLSAAETEALGERIGRQLTPSDVVFLIGELGAGKTALTRGIARGMGITDQVKSPTFTIVREYGDRLFHFDLYRISSEEELYDIDYEGYLSRGTCVVEWPSAAEPLGCTLRIEIARAEADPDARKITIFGDTDI